MACATVTKWPGAKTYALWLRVFIIAFSAQQSAAPMSRRFNIQIKVPLPGHCRSFFRQCNCHLCHHLGIACRTRVNNPLINRSTYD